MPVKKIWIAAPPEGKSLYALHSLGAVVGITALILALVAGGTVLTLYYSLPRESTLLGLCLGGVILGVVLALKAGRRSLRDALVFFLTQEDRLYLLDARTLARYRRGPAGYASMALDTQKLLDRLASSPTLPVQALEIVKVEKIAQGDRCSRVTCRVRRSTGQEGRWRFLLPEGYPEEDLLRFQLERRMGLDSSWMEK